MKATKKRGQVNVRLASGTFYRMKRISEREQRALGEVVRLVLEAALPQIETQSLTKFLESLKEAA